MLHSFTGRFTPKLRPPAALALTSLTYCLNCLYNIVYDDEMQGIGREVLRASLFSYAPNPDYPNYLLSFPCIKPAFSHPRGPVYSSGYQSLQQNLSALPNIDSFLDR